MKRSLKIFLAFIFTFIILTLGKNVSANSISKISMDIYIDESGNAQVTEIWNCRASQGTEVYHPYYNLGKSEITNLSVSRGEEKYTTLSLWNTSGTLESKAYKCGINKVSDGVEICWGISSYGSHTYTVNYTITNFVAELNDSQMVYWTLIPYNFSNSIGQVYIKIHTFYDIPDSTDVWGFGNYGGTAYVYDGYIEMQSDGTLSTSEYMVILAKFPSGTFNISNNKYNYDFDYYLDMAQEGATEYKSDNPNLGVFIFGVLGVFISGVLGFLMFFIPLFCIAKMGLGVSSGLDFGPEGKKIPKNVPYYREIPCNKDILRAYFIAYQYGLIKNKTDILGAIILKWLKDSLIKIEQREKGLIFKKENTVIILNETNPNNIKDEKEKELFRMLYEASKDGILENREFEKWCDRSYSQILNWFDKIILREKQKLVEEGLITLEEVKTLKIFKSNKYTATHELKQEAIEIAGLKKYLNDYTLIKEREAIEVTLFEEYLMFAQMLGIAKKVAEQFKRLYPEIIEQSNFVSYDNIIFINLCASHGISHANSAKSRAESYSSGGGGFSSGGGGGGSFGGGGGGRRLPLIKF